MSASLRLSDGVEIHVTVDVETLDKAYRAALRSDGLLRLETQDGLVVAINPHQVLYVSQDVTADEFGTTSGFGSAHSSSERSGAANGSTRPAQPRRRPVPTEA